MVLSEILKDVSKVAVGGHMRPDGDCVGSCMGLYLYLKHNCPQLQVDVYLEEIPESFRFIEEYQVIRHEVLPGAEYDLFIALDSGDSERLGFAEDLFKRTRSTVCIDHHISNCGYADANYIEPKASSTSELIYNLCDVQKITKAVAECLYLGIVHDTGVFQYSAAAPSTMEAAAQLMRKGIDASGIIERTFYQKTYNQNRILGYALLNSTLHLEGRCIASSLTLENLAEFEVGPKELDGIASQLRNTKGVETAIFLYELQKGEFKVSLRSGNCVDVSRIAADFGGGGHKKAAGLNRSGSAADIITAVLQKVEEQLNG